MATARKLTPRSLAYTVPGILEKDAKQIVALLQDRLNALNDLALTLKHIHWNVVGPHFIGVHTMLDPQAASVNEMIDQVAERITTLGGSPDGRPGTIVKQREWDDYSLGRDLVAAHLGALDQVYIGVITSHRDAIGETEEIDPVTQDLLIEQTEALEQFHWFVRAHLEDAGGHLADAGRTTEKSAAASARKADSSAPAKRRRASTRS